MKIEQYDIIELAEDLNANLKKGMCGTVVEKFSEDEFEIEVIDNKGSTVQLGNNFTFTVRKDQIIKI
ncbi:DUF4926 domain-containing protein [Pontibacter oryzae]|uniref:DUF4926 domain-containing protein n=1 Tax=Pontibacter oryzae TaxID=2304593 RepID=A0A399RUB9_9BACT|nr:DUF4926 domain-containing protein [Pontibacter oryzae]RIJ33487.1 DUF4926 domain-containing protein [Pontibacter oryzae]